MVLENHYPKNPSEIPEGSHGELAFQVGLQIDALTKQIYCLSFGLSCSVCVLSV